MYLIGILVIKYHTMINNFNYLHTALKRLDHLWLDVLLDNINYQNLINIDNNLLQLTKVNTIVLPSADLTFRALELVKLNDIQVVIIGQDPYHQINQANGLAFFVNNNIKLPPSLKNILMEINLEYQNIYHKDHYVIDNQLDIELMAQNWTKQGVLLLNSCLTVIANKPNSLQYLNWHAVIDNIINHINHKYKNIVFILWGNYAKTKTSLINNKKHLILYAPHPSPLSAYRGFFNCNHFITTNKYLQQHDKSVILW